jgi:hypothetical protein
VLVALVSLAQKPMTFHVPFVLSQPHQWPDSDPQMTPPGGTPLART